MIFSIDDGIFNLFSTLKIGVLICEINNTRYGNDQLEEALEDVRVHFSFERPEDHPNIKAWREAFEILGISGSKFQSSIEFRLKQALRGGPFPRINPLIDLSNGISLRRLVPIGGHSLDFIDGNISLCFAKGYELFVPMDHGEQEQVDEGEIVYKDNRDVLTRKWVWRQSNKDKVLDETKHVLISIDVLGGLPEWLCQSTINDLEESILRNGYGSIIHKDILTRSNMKTEFEY
ncbi:MAG TPA: phenylalanine--tRNA ligase beta subunit-related protein [Syntrophorhabdaceae bacterium]|nr:phenylalanine--tRNA ligase beta subunit-related protein [Syntrophorhabdaceae bacterium]